MANWCDAFDVDLPAFYHGPRAMVADASDDWFTGRSVSCQSALDLLLICTATGVEVLECNKFIKTMKSRQEKAGAGDRAIAESCRAVSTISSFKI